MVTGESSGGEREMIGVEREREGGEGDMAEREERVERKRRSVDVVCSRRKGVDHHRVVVVLVWNR